MPLHSNVELIKSLQGHTPSDATVNKPDYCKAWVRLRSLAELASADESAVELLFAFISSLTADEQLDALFTLFTEEWQLLGRSRLRQGLRPELRGKAVHYASSPGISSRTRIAAITFLRSQFADVFIDTLPAIMPLVTEDPAALRRTLYQVSTLASASIQREECLRFLEGIADQGQFVLMKQSAKWSNVQRTTFHNLLVAAKGLWLELTTNRRLPILSKRGAAQELRRILSEDPNFDHDTREFIRLWADNRDTINELTRNVFAAAWKDWQRVHESRLREIQSLLEFVTMLLLRTGSGGHGIIFGDLGYLEAQSRPVGNWIGSISNAVSYCAENEESTVFREIFTSAMASIHTTVTDENSTTVKLLSRLAQMPVRTFLIALETGILARFDATHRTLELSHSGIGTVNEKAAIFAPTDLVHACINNISDNLIRHAFSSDKAKIQPKIHILLSEARNSANEPVLTVEVKNNGEPLLPEAEMGHGARRINSDLAFFDGQYLQPTVVGELPWHVSQRITFLLW